MKSIDRLVAEHDIIERGLSVLEKFVAQIESGQSVSDEFLESPVQILGDARIEWAISTSQDVNTSLFG